MGVELVAWRARIGCFRHKPGTRQVDKVLPYNGHTTWAPGMDFAYRLTVVCMTALVFAVCAKNVLFVVDSVLSENNVPFSVVTGLGYFENCSTGAFIRHVFVSYTSETHVSMTHVLFTVYMPGPPAAGGYGTGGLTSTEYVQPHIGHLLVIGGVEVNPGPPKTNEALETLKKDLIAEIRRMRTDITQEMKDMKKDIRTIQTQCAEVESTCHDMREQMGTLTTKVHNIEGEVKDLREKENIFELDLAETNRRLENLEDRLDDIPEHSERIEQLEGEIEKLEWFSRRDNLIFHGIDEEEGEDYDACRATVLNILKDNIAQKDWVDRDIIRAHRLGKPDATRVRPRPVIVKFLHWRDKKIILHDKQNIIDAGYGVSNDLTWRQRDTLRKLEQEGKHGYFRGGKLIVNTRPLARGGTRGRGGRGGIRGGASNRESRPSASSQSSPSVSGAGR